MPVQAITLGYGAAAAAPLVAISDQLGSVAAAPSYVLNSSGSALLEGSAISGEWRLSGASGDYHAYWTLDSFTQFVGSGGYTAPAASTNLLLSTTRTWSIPAGGNSAELIFTVSIKKVSDGSVLDVAQITLSN